MAYSLGIGLTNECNLACAHCYRPQGGAFRLSFEDVRRTCHSLPFSSANLGTGENGLHPEFCAITEHLLERGLRTTLTTNGYTVTVMADTLLQALAEVEFSFDFPTMLEQDRFRGTGAWDLAMRSLDRCRALGLSVTIIAVMMRTNFRRLPAVACLARDCGANFRVNVYQPVSTDQFTLSYAEFWEGWRLLTEHAGIITTTEPLVHAVLGLNTLTGCACGRRTIRVTPARRVIPCVYWPEEGLALERLWEMGDAVLQTQEFCITRVLPQQCHGCAFQRTCAGGCAGRRILAGDIHAPDPYCPITRGELQRLSARMIAGPALLKAGSACTTILQANGSRKEAA